MKTKFLLATALVALGSAVAQAAVVPTYNAGDLVVGFRQTGASNSLEVDLGSFGQLLSAAPGSTIDFGNLGSQLGSDFGSVSNATWSLIAAQGPQTTVVHGTTFLPSALFVTQNVAPDAAGLSINTATALNSPISSIGTTLQGSTSLGTTGILAQSADISASNAQSYASRAPDLSALNGELTGAGTAALYQFNSLTAAVQVGKKLTPQSNLLPTLLGNFSVSGTGELSYTALAAIPEPSTYAAILGAATLGVALIRRRKQAALAV